MDETYRPPKGSLPRNSSAPLASSSPAAPAPARQGPQTPHQSNAKNIAEKATQLSREMLEAAARGELEAARAVLLERDALLKILAEEHRASAGEEEWFRAAFQDAYAATTHLFETARHVRGALSLEYKAFKEESRAAKSYQKNLR